MTEIPFSSEPSNRLFVLTHSIYEGGALQYPLEPTNDKIVQILVSVSNGSARVTLTILKEHP